MAAGRSKAAVLLLLIHCLLLLTLYARESVFGPCFDIHFLCPSRFAIILTGMRELVAYLNCLLLCNHLEGEEKTGCFAIIVLQMYCDCKCSAMLRQGAVGWTAA